MAAIEISSGLVLRDKKLLMFFDDENKTWNVPSVNDVSGEICADAAERVTSEVTGCAAEVVRYKRKLKVEFSDKERDFVWQPYIIDIEGTPEDGEWVPVSDIESKELPEHLRNAKEKLMAQF